MRYTVGDLWFVICDASCNLPLRGKLHAPLQMTNNESNLQLREWLIQFRYKCCSHIRRQDLWSEESVFLWRYMWDIIHKIANSDLKLSNNDMKMPNHDLKLSNNEMKMRNSQMNHRIFISLFNRFVASFHHFTFSFYHSTFLFHCLASSFHHSTTSLRCSVSS